MNSIPRNCSMALRYALRPVVHVLGAQLMEDGPGETLYAGKQIVSKAAPLSQPSAGCADTISTISRLPWPAQCSITIEKLHRRFFLRCSISIALIGFNIIASTSCSRDRDGRSAKRTQTMARGTIEQISAV